MLRLPNCTQKKSGSRRCAGRRKISLFKRIGRYGRSSQGAAGKARNSAISSPFAVASAWLQKARQAGKDGSKGAFRTPAGGVDSKPRQWHLATTGHAMTVAVGDGRGFSSLAAAPDGRAPARCTARSWPVPLPASTCLLRNQAPVPGLDLDFWDFRTRSPRTARRRSPPKACHVWPASVCNTVSSSAVSARSTTKDG